MAGGVVALTAYLLLATGSTWELMLYYPVKAMWTGIVVLIPLAVVGSAVCCRGFLAARRVEGAASRDRQRRP